MEYGVEDRKKKFRKRNWFIIEGEKYLIEGTYRSIYLDETEQKKRRVGSRCSYLCKRELKWQTMENLPGSSSSSAQSICPLHSANGKIVHCNTIQMVNAVADNRKKVNDSLKSIVNGWNDGNSYP